MLFHQIGVKAVVSGRNRSVSRKHDFPCYLRNSLLEADALFFHPLSNGFEDGKSAMPFVQVKDSRSNAKSFQRSQTTNAQKQFLMHPNPAIAAVQTRGHHSIFRCIAFHIRVEKKQIAASDFNSPNFCMDRAMASIDLHYN